MLPAWWRASLNAVNIICSHVYAYLIINGRQRREEEREREKFLSSPREAVARNW